MSEGWQAGSGRGESFGVIGQGKGRKGRHGRKGLTVRFWLPAMHQDVWKRIGARRKAPEGWTHSKTLARIRAGLVCSMRQVPAAQADRFGAPLATSPGAWGRTTFLCVLIAVTAW